MEKSDRIFVAGHRGMVGSACVRALAAAGAKEQILIAEIDRQRIAEVRAQLPTFLHLREDVYTVAD